MLSQNEMYRAGKEIAVAHVATAAPLRSRSPHSELMAQKLQAEKSFSELEPRYSKLNDDYNRFKREHDELTHRREELQREHPEKQEEIKQFKKAHASYLSVLEKDSREAHIYEFKISDAFRLLVSVGEVRIPYELFDEKFSGGFDRFIDELGLDKETWEEKREFQESTWGSNMYYYGSTLYGFYDNENNSIGKIKKDVAVFRELLIEKIKIIREYKAELLSKIWNNRYPDDKKMLQFFIEEYQLNKSVKEVNARIKLLETEIEKTESSLSSVSEELSILSDSIGEYQESIESASEISETELALTEESLTEESSFEEIAEVSGNERSLAQNPEVSLTPYRENSTRIGVAVLAKKYEEITKYQLRVPFSESLAKVYIAEAASISFNRRVFDVVTETHFTHAKAQLGAYLEAGNYNVDESDCLIKLFALEQLIELVKSDKLHLNVEEKDDLTSWANTQKLVLEDKFERIQFVFSYTIGLGLWSFAKGIYNGAQTVCKQIDKGIEYIHDKVFSKEIVSGLFLHGIFGNIVKLIPKAIAYPLAAVGGIAGFAFNLIEMPVQWILKGLRNRFFKSSPEFDADTLKQDAGIQMNTVSEASDRQSAQITRRRQPGPFEVIHQKVHRASEVFNSVSRRFNRGAQSVTRLHQRMLETGSASPKSLNGAGERFKESLSGSMDLVGRTATKMQSNLQSLPGFFVKVNKTMSTIDQVATTVLNPMGHG